MNKTIVDIRGEGKLSRKESLGRPVTSRLSGLSDLKQDGVFFLLTYNCVFNLIKAVNDPDRSFGGKPSPARRENDAGERDVAFIFSCSVM